MPFLALRGFPYILAGPDLAGTGAPALDFTGSAGSTGDTWMAVNTDSVSTEPENSTGPEFFGLEADVLIHRFDNRKGVGLFALYNPDTGKGLALILYDAGNSDALVLATVDQNGRLTPLKSVFLGAAILEDVWYHMAMTVQDRDADLTVTGSVFRHVSPLDPDSGLGLQVGSTLEYTGSRPQGVGQFGEFGAIGSAINAHVESSVTNFCVLL